MHAEVAEKNSPHGIGTGLEIAWSEARVEHIQVLERCLVGRIERNDDEIESHEET